ncbi:MAG: hypothetical protein ACTHJR_11015 [Sphingomonas sp.]|uniref:hypothetical protein n=1 Tax=Sphingomonas sp. TaxID=28214 RepID=UPI003F7FFF9A
MTDFNSVAATMGDDIKAFRSANVTAFNKATPLARSILAGLMAGVVTASVVTSAVISSFGNPKTPAGKPITKLSGSGDHLPGWGATRKTVAAILKVFEDIDADKDTTGDVRKNVTAFVLQTDGAPKSLAALQALVRENINAHVQATLPEVEPSEEEQQEITPDADTPAPTDEPLIDLLNRATVAVGAADVHALIAADDSMAKLMEALNAAFAKVLANENPEELQKAA